MEVICMEDSAFYALVDKVAQLVKERHGVKEDTWISGEEAMRKLGISSKTTLQKMRDEGAIRYSQAPDRRKIILYDVNSIYAYLEKHTKETF